MPKLQPVPHFTGIADHMDAFANEESDVLALAALLDVIGRADLQGIDVALEHDRLTEGIAAVARMIADKTEKMRHHADAMYKAAR